MVTSREYFKDFINTLRPMDINIRPLKTSEKADRCQLSDFLPYILKCKTDLYSTQIICQIVYAFSFLATADKKLSNISWLCTFCESKCVSWLERKWSQNESDSSFDDTDNAPEYVQEEFIKNAG